MKTPKRTVLGISNAASRTGNSFRVTLPRKVVERMGLTTDENIVVFVLEDEKIVLEKLKHL
jgi:antitoxin component of MazEF toxin-antitoxin module